MRGKKLWTQIERGWLPHEQRPTLRVALITALGSFVGLLVVAVISRAVVGAEDVPYIAAYMGAAAVLMFGAPDSPLCQPWPLIGGHVLSGVVGVTCYRLIPDVMIASVSAVALAILVMQLLRCLHPPGGAAAMVAVIGGPGIHALGYGYALVPVGLNALVLLGIAVLINNAIPGRRYPSPPTG
ncbi:MAG TPA: HPP family protein [Enhygromyxa sp.]|nr:HPP family protein [Enhygromyxa sp.]